MSVCIVYYAIVQRRLLKPGSQIFNIFCRNEYLNSSFTRDLEQLVLESQYGTRCMNPDIYQIDGKPCGEMESPLKWTKQNEQISPKCECETTGEPWSSSIK